MSDNSVLVRAKYSRTKQIAQYEPSVAEVETSFTGTLDNLDGQLDVALDRCKTAVERVLGIQAKVQALVATQASQTATQASQTATQTVQPAAPARVGRPTKAEAEAKKLATAALANADPMAEALGDTTNAQPNISTGDERSDPMADVVTAKPADAPANDGLDDMGIPNTPAPAAKPITDSELQNEAGKAVQRTGNSKAVRALVADTGAANIAGIAAEKRADFVDKLKRLKPDGTLSENK